MNLLKNKEDNDDISVFTCKLQTMINDYVDSMICKEMENYKTYREVYDHILKLPMVSSSLENSVTKVHTHMSKKIADLTNENIRLGEEICSEL